MNLAVRAIAAERMDDPALDPAIYAAVLRDLARVNRVTLAARPTLAFLATVADRPFRLLDVGFGDGDMLRTIRRWADRHGIAAELVGIDLNPMSAAIARADTPADMRIDWRTGDYAGVADEQWDVVISSLVAHHMTRGELVAFLRFMDAHARRGWLVNDLHRHRFAHAGWPLLARLFGWHEVVRGDGRLSIARSYRPPEWPPLLAEAGVTGARIDRWFPFRLCVSKRA